MADRQKDLRSREWLTTGVIDQLQQLETELGGRQILVQTLMLAPLTADLRYIVGMLGDPKHTGKSLAEICAAGNILPGELLKQIRAAAVLRGQVLAAQEVSSQIPNVVADVMRRAAPYEDACHACLGAGTITPEPTKETPNPSPEPCETCRGTGKLTYRPTLDTQRLAIDLAQLIPKSGGLNILNQQIAGTPQGNNSGAGASPLEKLSLLTDRLLYGTAPTEPVEGEVLEAEGPD